MKLIAKENTLHSIVFYLQYFNFLERAEESNSSFNNVQEHRANYPLPGLKKRKQDCLELLLFGGKCNEIHR